MLGRRLWFVASYSTSLVVGSAAYGAISADAVVDYAAGSAPTTYWGAPYLSSSALGLPRAQHDLNDAFDGDGNQAIYGNHGYTTPFNPAFQPEEVAAIGAGGTLTLHLSGSVATTGRNLGVHSDIGMADAAYPAGHTLPVAGIFGDRFADVAVSADNVTWFSLGRVQFNLPSNYFTDVLPNPSDQGTPSVAGTTVADFSKPFLGQLSDFNDLDYAGVLNVLNGSGGGTWIDLSPASVLGPTIQYVRFSLPANEPANHYMFVDAVTAVPEPAGVAVLAITALLPAVRRRRSR